MRLPLVVGVGVVAAFAVAAVMLTNDDGPPATVLDPPAPSEATTPEAGEIRFLRNASSAFDPYLLDPDPDNRAFIRDTYWRLRGYPPVSDDAIEWGPPIHFYQDLYALYPEIPADQALIDGHPDWVLRDEAGEPLYIPFDCAEGACAAYAADVGNPDFQAEWIERARAELAKGYAGVFIDNVNMIMRVSDGLGVEIPPVDARTGEPMALADWQRYVAEFTERIRDELPEAEITHNVIWFAERSPAVRRQLEAADYVELERGFTDSGIAGSDGSAYDSFLEHIDWVHGLGRPVLLEPFGLDVQKREFELANYFLINEGADAIAADFEADPVNWWPGWETSLGAPLGERQEAHGGILRRDFENGLVLVNPPGAPQRALELPEPHTDLDGAPVESLTLGPAEGAVLLRAAP